MPKKLDLDNLNAEITSTLQLLESAKEFGDLIGETQLQQKLNLLLTQKENTATIAENLASVAILFGGKPVLGSKGIVADFAGEALKHFQDVISKIYAKETFGDLGKRGKIPNKPISELMITGLARGSFGFVLDEVSEQDKLTFSELSHIIEETTLLLKDIASESESIFEDQLINIDKRTLVSLKKLFNHLDNSQATFRVIEQDMDISWNSEAIHRAKQRIDSTEIEEESIVIEGILKGFLPDHKKFELKLDEDEMTIYGSVSKEAIEQFEDSQSLQTGVYCKVSIIKKVAHHLNSLPKESFFLNKFL